MNILAPDYLARLGKGTNGRSYLSGAMAADVRRRYLSPANAARAFQDVADDDTRAMQGLDKAYAQFKRGLKVPRKVYPLPL